MPVDRANNFTFIHIPKVAGTSIEKHLEIYGENDKFSLDIGFGRFEHNGETYALQHISHLQLLELGIINKDEFDSYYSFAFVRNPWDRAVSDYKWQKNVLKKDITFRKYLKKTIAIYENYKSSRLINYENCHYVPQSWYVMDRDNIKTVNYIGKYEHLYSNFQHVLKEIKYKNNILQQANEGKSLPYFFYYWDVRNILLVSLAYKEDIDNFKYNFFTSNAMKLFINKIKSRILS